MRYFARLSRLLVLASHSQHPAWQVQNQLSIWLLDLLTANLTAFKCAQHVVLIHLDMLGPPSSSNFGAPSMTCHTMGGLAQALSLVQIIMLEIYKSVVDYT